MIALHPQPVPPVAPAVRPHGPRSLQGRQLAVPLVIDVPASSATAQPATIGVPLPRGRLWDADTLVLLHTCPHPLDPSREYPRRPIAYQLSLADPVAEDDYCRTFRPENERGFENNRIYHIGSGR